MQWYWIVLFIMMTLIVLVYFGIKGVLDKGVRGGAIQLSMKPLLGICPSTWNKIYFNSGSMCVDPQATAFSDACLNYVGAGRGYCPQTFQPFIYNSLTYCLETANLASRLKTNSSGCAGPSYIPVTTNPFINPSSKPAASAVPTPAPTRIS